MTQVPQADLDRLLALYNRARYPEAVRVGAKLAGRYPGSLMVHNVRGAACIAARDFPKAEAAFRQAIQLEPRHAELHSNLGAALEPQGKLDAAVAAYQHALVLRPNHVSAHYNLGNTLRKQHAIPAAIASYERAIALKPDHAEAYNNLGLCLQQSDEPAEALRHFGQALQLKPDFVDAIYNLATALMDLREYGRAADAFALVLDMQPDHFAATRQLAHAQTQLCDFAAARDFPAMRPAMAQNTAPVPPFIMLPLIDDPEQQLLYSREGARTMMISRSAPPRRASPSGEQRIRLGYFSADFHDHATMCLMTGLFREHDRQRFDVACYSYGPDSNDAARIALLGHVDRFVEIRDMSDAEILGLVHGDGLDIAIDLKGYTKDSRSRLFASRLAPIQINYLGYPGSLGAECMDYLIADPVVVPADSREFYAEKIITLPGSYQPNDNQRAIGGLDHSRADAGLPEEGFVFCCFNQAYKIGPAEFAIWMRLLTRVGGSVLWLLRPTAEVAVNLRREAAAHGVDPARLVFATPLPPAAHLARLRLADLFLDTFHYNAHTTASDALWAGLPVVTKAGRQFAARVGASLLHAAGLPDLVTTNAEDYAELALDLATTPAKLAAVRQRLADNRLTCPLFDTVAHTRKLEAAYIAAHQRHREGLTPSELSIA
ncbi:MAG: repeat-containing protein [Novosphingobium sp.]|nr:repeat-containing protein [Novosphingobium sp.]